MSQAKLDICVLFTTPCLRCYSGTLSFPSLRKDFDKYWWERSLPSLRGASRSCLCLPIAFFLLRNHFVSIPALLKLLRLCICRGVSLCRGIRYVEGIGFARQNLSARADNSHVLHCSPLSTTSQWKSRDTFAAVSVLSKTSFFWGFSVDQSRVLSYICQLCWRT